MFDNKKSASKGKPLLYQILFKTVENVEIQRELGIIIFIQQQSKFIFSSSEDINMELFGYCKLLCVLSDYVIPEIPKRCLVLQQDIECYSDPNKFGTSEYFRTSSGLGTKWVVTPKNL